MYNVCQLSFAVLIGREYSHVQYIIFFMRKFMDGVFCSLHLQEMTSTKRKMVKNVRILHLHRQQQKTVHVDGVAKSVTIVNIDPILNIVNALCGEERLVLTVSNFEARQSEEQGNTDKRSKKVWY